MERRLWRHLDRYQEVDGTQVGPKVILNFYLNTRMRLENGFGRD